MSGTRQLGSELHSLRTRYGHSLEQVFDVGPHSRLTVPAWPVGGNPGHGAVIESIDASPVPIVVERSRYGFFSGSFGLPWTEGTCSVAVPLIVR